MNLLPEPLQLFVRDSLNPKKIAGHPISSTEFETWKSFLTNEIATIKSLTACLPESKRGKNKAALAILMDQVVDLSNTIYSYLTKLHPVWKTHVQADQIKTGYLFTCNAFEELLSALSASHPFFKGQTKITNYQLPQVIMHLKERHRLLTAHLDGAAIDPELKEIVLVGIYQLILQKNLTGQAENYVSNLTALLLNTDNLDTRRLMGLMITHNFNLPEFFHYCVNTWRRSLAEIPGLHEQLEMLLVEKDLLYELHIHKGLQIPHASSVLYEDLNQFLAEKYQYTKQLLKLRREAVRDKERAKAGLRFLMSLPVPQFGLFIRMQIEKGLLPKEKVGELFSFFALHFYTPNTLFISAESLQKKSTDVEFSTAQKMKGHLIGMLNWLNTNFNLSNYN